MTHTPESLAALSGVELARLCARDVMGWVDDHNLTLEQRAWWSGDNQRYLVSDFRPDLDANNNLEMRDFLADQHPDYAWEYQQVNMADGPRLHEWAFWGGETGDSVGAYSGEDELISCCIAAILSAQALGKAGG